jgi:hypothetical protein
VTRRWNEDDLAAADNWLAERGLIDDAGRATDEGRAVRGEVERWISRGRGGGNFQRSSAMPTDRGWRILRLAD